MRATGPKPASAPGHDRRRAYHWGLSAETRAAWLLRLTGYRILDRRFKAGRGEVDLVARRGHTVVFVEVKARASFEAALEAVTPRTRHRIVAAADLWMARHPAFAGFDRRFDIVMVMPWRCPRHLSDAFWADD